MSTYALTYPQLKALDPCKDDFDSVTAALGDENSWDGRLITAAKARAAGVSMDHVVWVASRLALSNTEIERRLQHWNCDCAMRVLANFETRVPGDDRPRAAIEAGRRYADGLIGLAECNAARIAAKDAAKDATKDAAGTAARAAARAAASDAGDAGWSASWSAADTAYQSVTDATDAAWSAAKAAEQDWQFTRLCEWMSDTPPPPPLN